MLADLSNGDRIVRKADGGRRPEAMREIPAKEKPAKDMGNIIKKLSPGDTVHIAAGVYLGKGKNGSDVITVPVSIIGGYSDDFSRRDP